MFPIQIGVNGILLGGLYALMALGLSIVWGVMNIINIAHGAFIMLGAYTTFWLFKILHIDPFVSILVSMVALFILGYVIQRYLINLLVRGEMFLTLLLAFGIEILIMNLARLAWTANLRHVVPSYAGISLSAFGITIPLVRLLSFFVALFLTGILFYVFKNTKTGRQIRATSQDLLAARLVGVKVPHTYALTFGIGVALAGAAGSLWSMLFTVSPTMGGLLTLKSFIVTIIGGLGTMVGPIIGGLILGLAEKYTAVYLGPSYQNLMGFGLMVLILIVRPQGLLGGKKE